MARAVYYDPFGQRVTGYRAGIEDEMRLQDQTRRARASDFDYNNIAPIQLEQLQRQNQLEQFADPYLRNQYGIQQRANLAGLANTELNIGDRIGQATGNYAFPLATAINYGSGRSLGSEQYLPAQIRQYSDVLNQNQPGTADVMANDYISNLALNFGIDPVAFQQAMQMLTGRINPAAEAGYDSYLGFDRARQLAGDNRQLNMDAWNRQIQQQNAITNAQRQNTQEANIMGLLQRWGINGNGASANIPTYDEDGF